MNTCWTSPRFTFGTTAKGCDDYRRSSSEARLHGDRALTQETNRRRCSTDIYFDDDESEAIVCREVPEILRQLIEELAHGLGDDLQADDASSAVDRPTRIDTPDEPIRTRTHDAPSRMTPAKARPGALAHAYALSRQNAGGAPTHERLARDSVDAHSRSESGYATTGGAGMTRSGEANG